MRKDNPNARSIGKRIYGRRGNTSEVIPGYFIQKLVPLFGPQL
jgi:hypothetical protein